MIFAPRSCPSRPGFAITTLIFAATVGQYRNVRLRVVGCSPAWPNPGGAQSGYLLEHDSHRLLLDCGPGVLAKLREHDGGWPSVDAIVVTHWHLDHWGDLVPWVWGTLAGPGQGREQVELFVPPGGLERLREFGGQLGWEDMWTAAFDFREYVEGETFRAAGFDVRAVALPHYTLSTYGMHVGNGAQTFAYSGDTGPSERLAQLATGVDLFLCEATLERGDLDGEPRGHLSADEAVASFDASGAKRLLLTHRPHELSLAAGLEQAYDGLEVDL
jgi:ribonuclease BN (tRNA processing enzyme)